MSKIKNKASIKLKKKLLNQLKQKITTSTLDDHESSLDDQIIFDGKLNNKKISYPINSGIKFRDQQDCEEVEEIQDKSDFPASAVIQSSNKEAVAIIAGVFAYIISHDVFVSIIVYIIVRMIKMSENFQIFPEVFNDLKSYLSSMSSDVMNKGKNEVRPTIIRQIKSSQKKIYVDPVTKKEVLKIVRGEHNFSENAASISLDRKVHNFIDMASMAKSLSQSQQNDLLEKQKMKMSKAKIIKQLNLSNEETIAFNQKLRLIENEISSVSASKEKVSEILPTESRVNQLINDRARNKRNLERQLSQLQ